MFYDIIQNTDFSCIIIIIIIMLLTVPLYVLCSPDFRHETGWSSGWRRWRLKLRPLRVRLCARQFSHHGNLLFHKKNQKKRSSCSATHAHTRKFEGTSVPPPVPSLVFVWGTKPCFMWRKVEAVKEACVRVWSLRLQPSGFCFIYPP